jgi:hypothetical protein
MLEMLNIMTFMHEIISYLFYIEKVLKVYNVFSLSHHTNDKETILSCMLNIG